MAAGAPRFPERRRRAAARGDTRHLQPRDRERVAVPYVKCISGHTSAHAVQRYLERGGRALATDFLNIDVPVSGVREGLEDHGRVDWWREMDSARRLRKRHRLERAPRADVEALHIRPDILAAFGIIIRYSSACWERVAWHLEDVVFHGMAYRLLVSHLVLLGRNEAQRVASIRRSK